MEYFQTPVRRKVNEFHSQIRAEQLSKMKATVRAINEQSFKKQSQHDRFNKLCQKLAANSNNQQALQEMKKMYKQEGFIIKQSNARKINLALKQFLKMSQLKDVQERNKDDNLNKNEIGCYIKRQKKQSIINLFCEILILLTRNANRYPKYGCFDGPQILNTFIDILKTTSHESIIFQTLRLLVFVSQNINTKLYLLSKNIVSILAQQKFLTCSRLIEQFLADIFNIREFKVTQQNVDELILFFDVHKQNIYCRLDSESMNEIYFFIKCLTQQVSNKVKNYGKFVDLMFFLLRKCKSVDFNENQIHKLYYAKIIHKIILLIGQKIAINQDNKNCLMQHLQKFWKLNTETIKKYSQVIDQIFKLSLNLNPKNDFQLQMQRYETIINSFMTLFQFITLNFSKNEKVKIYTEQLLYHFYDQFKKGSKSGKLTLTQFRFFIKYYENLQDCDLNNMMDWYQQTLQDKQCRIQCLKKLSIAARNQSVSLQQYTKLSSLYQEQRQNFQQKFDQLTEFILNYRPIPSTADIERKQHMIKYLKQEEKRKLIQENLKKEVKKQEELNKQKEKKNKQDTLY